MHTQETRLKNDLMALRFVRHFGWLRIAELGALMKPNTNTSMEAGARLARGLIERRLVLSRRLPAGAGQALVLATAGVRFLAEHGMQASVGKDIGHTYGKQWLPPATWRHDLLAHGVLCYLHSKGYQIMPEAEIRRLADSSSVKLPDGMVKAPAPNEKWIWLEVENARKSGPHMRKLVETLVGIAERKVELCGMRPVGCLIAYWRDSLDERGHQINHRHRIVTALAAAAPRDVPVTFMECARRGAVGVASIDTISTTVESSRVSRALERLNENGWHSDSDSSYIAQSGVCRAYVWLYSEEDNIWSYSAEGKGWRGPAGFAGSAQEAKRMAAELIARQ